MEDLRVTIKIGLEKMRIAKEELVENMKYISRIFKALEIFASHQMTPILVTYPVHD